LDLKHVSHSMQGQSGQLPESCPGC
jgi:hypothetical protein